MKKRVVRGVLILAAGMGVFAWSVPWALPRLLSWWRTDVLFHGDVSGKKLYLTIDDAPSASTPELLRVLKKYKVPATFFVIGNRVHTDVQLSSIVADGYSLGHHMRTTERCSRIPIDRFHAEFDYTDVLLRRFMKSAYFRPPSDLGTVEQMEYVHSKGYQPILGTVFPLDHWIQRPAVLALIVRWLAVPGGIVIMHDGDQRGHTTAKVLDAVLPLLKAAGYEFDPLPQRTNQALEPTTLAVTIPAGQKVGPAGVVADR